MATYQRIAALILVLAAAAATVDAVSLRPTARADGPTPPPPQPPVRAAGVDHEAVPLSGGPVAVPGKPKLRLTFEALVSMVSGDVQKVSVDRKRFAVSAHNVPISRRAEGQDGTLLDAASTRPLDGAIIDLADGRAYMHQRFFDELVCYMHDLEGGAAAQPGRRLTLVSTTAAAAAAAARQGGAGAGNDTAGDAHGPKNATAAAEARRLAAEHEAFKDWMLVAALSDVLQAPLGLYSASESFNTSRSIAGLPCEIWGVNQSIEMPLEDLMSSVAGSPELSGHSLPALEDLVRTVQNATNGTGHRPSPGPLAMMSFQAAFCVTPQGQLLSADTTRSITINVARKGHLKNSTAPPTRLALWSETGGFAVAEVPGATPPLTRFEAVHGVAGGRCVDLTSGRTGRRELGYRLNSPERIRRINEEAGGAWVAMPYGLWNGMTVAEVVPSLGTHIEPLRLPLGRPVKRRARPLLALLSRKPPTLPPRDFDARDQWPQCATISYIRNQGMCGSCWAFAATGVLSDRFCIAASQRDRVSRAARGRGRGRLATLGGNSTFLLEEEEVGRASLALSPEHLVDCEADSGGCGGGRLDDVWQYLRDHGTPAESCRPYRYCAVPTHPQCGGRGARPSDPEAFLEQRRMHQSGSREAWCSAEQCAGGGSMVMRRASAAYAVGLPGDVVALQRELLARGPVEVGFFVFSDFHSYRRGVYFRTPGAFGPLGGHAVRLIGYGIDEAKKSGKTDYWLAANSWSPSWGMSGFFRIRRGTNECGIETTPAAGLPRMDDDAGHQKELI